MSYNLALIIALAGPAILLTVLRINAALLFLSLCLGAVLVEYVAGEANSLITLFSDEVGTLSASTLQLVLLFAPAAVTCVVTIFGVHGRLRVMLNSLPAMAASAFAVILAVPVLGTGLKGALEQQPAWQYLTKAQALVVGMGAVISLAFLWTQRRHLRQRERKHR